MESIKQTIERKSHGLKRIVQKAFIEMHRKTSLPKVPKVPYYYECLEICKRMLSSKDTVLLVAPISSKRYMKNEKFEIYVILHGRTIEVINHVYNYTVHMDEDTWTNLIDTFNEELESRREDIEDEIAKNIKYSLKNVIKGMEEKK